MLWNWRIVDSCILAESWHIKSNAMFAASCVGAALLVVALEFLRRLSSEWDAFLLRQFQRQLRIQQGALAGAASSQAAATGRRRHSGLNMLHSAPPLPSSSFGPSSMASRWA
ncbi:hypothetical protein PMIN06_006409 [Paraphaeosphaeria minitans]